MRGLFSVAVIPDAPVESASPIVAAVGEWSTPKKSGSLPTASAVANAQSGRWERLERLNEREAGCAVVRHYAMREPRLCQHYTGRHHAQADGASMLRFYLTTECPMATYYRKRQLPPEPEPEPVLSGGGPGRYVPPSRRDSGGPRRMLARPVDLADARAADSGGGASAGEGSGGGGGGGGGAGGGGAWRRSGVSWSTRMQPPAQKSAGKGRAQRQQEEKKEGKGGMLVPSNAWAALASDSEDEDSDSDASDAQSEQEEEEEGTEPDAASEPASAPVVAIGRSDDPKIQQLLDLGASREQAVESLEQAGGDGTSHSLPAIDFVFAQFPGLRMNIMR